MNIRKILAYQNLVQNVKRMLFLQKYWKYILGIVVILVVLSLVPFNCSGKTTRETKTTYKDSTIVIPEMKGQFESPKSFEENPGTPDTIYITKNVYIKTDNPVDKKLIEEYKKAARKDSTEGLKKYAEAIQERSYTTDFSDDKIELSVDTKVRGELLSQTPKYKIKEQSIRTQIKTVETTITKEVKDPFGVLVGAGVQQNLSDKKTAVSVDAGIRINKVNILGTLNTNKEAGLKILIEL